MDTARILDFDTQFDGTHMSPKQITDEVRRRGWASMELGVDRALYGDGILMVRRISSAEVGRDD